MRSIIICDDNKDERMMLKEMVREYYKEDAKILLCADGNELEEELRRGKADIIFLDIKMPGENGLEIKDRLQKLRTASYIIFVTSHMNFMPDAFGINVMGYLPKPPEKDRLYNIFASIDNDEIQSREIEAETTLNEIIKIRLEHIRYIEADRKYSFIHTKDKKISVYKSLNQWEDKLKGEYFIRIHKSYLVNLEYVEKIDSKFLYMKEREEDNEKKKERERLNLTRDKEKRKKIQEAFMEYIRKTARQI